MSVRTLLWFLSTSRFSIDYRLPARFVNLGDGQYNMTAAERQVHDGVPISLTGSSGVLTVMAQEPAKPLATTHTPLPTCLRDPREQQHVGLPLMIPFVRNIFVQRPTQAVYHSFGAADLIAKTNKHANPVDATSGRSQASQ